MGISDSDISRLLAGEIPTEDLELGEVSTLLARIQTALPTVSPAACADRHLAVVSREARLVAAAREQDRRNTVPDRVRTRLGRAIAAIGASVLVALTAGVGLATAMGVDPLQLVSGFVVGQPVSPETGLPGAEPEDDRTDDPADGTKGGNPFTPVVDPSVGTPSPTDGQPTATPTAEPSTELTAEPTAEPTTQPSDDASEPAQEEAAEDDPDEGKKDKKDKKDDKGRPDEGSPDKRTPDEGRPDEGTPDEGRPDEGRPDKDNSDKVDPADSGGNHGSDDDNRGISGDGNQSKDAGEASPRE